MLQNIALLGIEKILDKDNFNTIKNLFKSDEHSVNEILSIIDSSNLSLKKKVKIMQYLLIQFKDETLNDTAWEQVKFLMEAK